MVVGFDRWINYYKIQYAQLCLNELPGCEFIATNRDAVTHLTDAQEWAGNNAMVSAIVGCTGREPIVVGKPSPLMVEYLKFKFNIDPYVIESQACILVKCDLRIALLPFIPLFNFHLIYEGNVFEADHECCI